MTLTAALFRDAFQKDKMQTKKNRADARAGRSASMHAARHAERGILLAECLVYIGVFMVVIGAALASFYHALDYSKRLRSNADDIARALRVGEQWRSDVRSATGQIRLEKGAGGIALCIPLMDREVAYVFSTNAIVRINSGDGTSEKLLAGVKACSFHRENRGPVMAWRWELEFARAMKAVRVTPGFTFTAVPGSGTRP